MLRASDGRDLVVIYLKKERAVKRLPASRSVLINEELLARLGELYGEENVRMVDKKMSAGGRHAAR